MKRAALYVLTFAFLFVLVTDAFAIGSNRRRRIRVKILGDCDAAINNLKDGPEQVSDITDGTECTARISLWKRTNNSLRRRRPLRAKNVEFGIRTSANGSYSQLVAGTTNNRGKADLTFNWSVNACQYRAVFGADEESEMADFVRTLITSEVPTCDTFF